MAGTVAPVTKEELREMYDRLLRQRRLEAGTRELAWPDRPDGDKT